MQDELILIVPPLPPEEITRQLDELRDARRKDLVDKLGEILPPLLQKTGRTEAEIDLVRGVFRNDLRQEMKISTLTTAPVFLPGSRAAFDEATQILSFRGMDVRGRIDGATGNSDRNPEYLAAIGEMQRVPPLWVKFILPFLAEAPLASLPAVNFSLLPKNLADKISYDGERINASL